MWYVAKSGKRGKAWRRVSTASGATRGKGKGKSFPCEGAVGQRFSTKDVSPAGHGLCASTLPLNTVATGKDANEWIVVMSDYGDRIWEQRRYPRNKIDELRYLNAPPKPALQRKMRVLGGGSAHA